MNLQKARNDLFDTTFLIGHFRQNSALKYLAASKEDEGMDVLIEALEKGIRVSRIEEILLSQNGQNEIDHLWRTWASGRSIRLATVLKKKGAPCRLPALHELSLLKLGKTETIAIDRGTMRRVFALFEDADPDIRQGILSYVGSLPKTEEAADEIYGTWLKYDAEPLAKIIRNKGQRPSNPAMEALFLLLAFRVDEYLALENDRGELFQEAYAMASEPLQVRLNEVVLSSGNRRLADAYEKAMAGRGNFSSDLFIKARKTAEDDKGLFEATKYMTLTGLLDLCKRWSGNGWRPEKARERELVDRAVAAYAKVGDVEVAVDAPTPSGTSDIFDYWRNQKADDKELLAGLDNVDPFVRMRSLYLGGLRNILPAGRLAKAAGHPDWPERLAARLAKPRDKIAEDHVAWVNTCGGGELFTAPVDCTPEELEYFGGILYQLPEKAGGFAGSYRALTAILHAFQSIHAVGRIVVADDDGAREQGAVQVTDLEDVPGDVEF